MNVLLIGGTGVLSTAVTKEALRKGINVSMVNRGNRTHLIPQGVELIKADRTEKNKIAEKIGNRRFDAIIDFICYTEDQTIDSFDFYHKYTNQYFYISSCAVYDTRKGGVCDEESPKVLPMWWYSKAKWESETRLRELAAEKDVNITIIRPSVTYDDTRIPYGISPRYGYHWTFVERIRHNKPIITWNGGNNRTNMMRVEDFAVGLVGLIGNAEAYNQAFNICGDEAPTYREVLGIVESLAEHKAETVDIRPEFYAAEAPGKSGELLGGRAIDSINSNDKIKSFVPSFSQRIQLREGVSKTYSAYKDVPHQKGIDWQFEGETDRVIAKWCKKNGIDSRQYNLGFIDYLGNATRRERFEYYREFHKDKCYMRILSLAVRIIGKVIRK